jgi:predicted RNase H-like HicB family nuclease
MALQWSDEDQVFIASLLEFGPYCKTHWATYEEAARQGHDPLESLIDTYRVDGQALPEAIRFGSAIPTSQG